MVLRDGSVGLIDFGQCCALNDESRKRLCSLVMLLRLRSPALLKLTFADLPSLFGDFDFKFNTADVDEIGALFAYFFDTDATAGGTVDPATYESIRRTARYKPAALPIATDCPKEVVFFGRVVASLRKCFEKVGLEGFSVVDAWYGVARRSLAELRAAEDAPDRVADSLLALLPADPGHLELQRSLAMRFLDVPDAEKAAAVDAHRPMLAAAVAAPEFARNVAGFALLRPGDLRAALVVAGAAVLFAACSLVGTLARWALT